MFVRFAHQEDLDAIIEGGAEGVLKNEWAPLRHFDVAGTRERVSKFIDQRLVFVAQGEGGIVGFVVIREQHWVFDSNARYLEVAALYVTPKGRRLRDDRLGTSTAGALLRACQHLSEALGLNLYAPMMWGNRIAARDRFLRRSGFQSVGSTFVFEPSKIEILQAAE